MIPVIMTSLDMKRNSGQRLRQRILFLAEFQDSKCFFCFGDMIFLDPEKQYTTTDPNLNLDNQASIDHFVARSMGGPLRAISNQVIACRRCNSEKHHHEPDAETIERFNKLNEVREKHPIFIMSQQSRYKWQDYAQTYDEFSIPLGECAKIRVSSETDFS